MIRSEEAPTRYFVDQESGVQPEESASDVERTVEDEDESSRSSRHYQSERLDRHGRNHMQRVDDDAEEPHDYLRKAARPRLAYDDVQEDSEESSSDGPQQVGGLLSDDPEDGSEEEYMQKERMPEHRHNRDQLLYRDMQLHKSRHSGHTRIVPSGTAHYSREPVKEELRSAYDDEMRGQLPDEQESSQDGIVRERVLHRSHGRGQHFRHNVQPRERFSDEAAQGEVTLPALPAVTLKEFSDVVADEPGEATSQDQSAKDGSIRERTLQYGPMGDMQDRGFDRSGPMARSAPVHAHRSDSLDEFQAGSQQMPAEFRHGPGRLSSQEMPSEFRHGPGRLQRFDNIPEPRELWQSDAASKLDTVRQLHEQMRQEQQAKHSVSLKEATAAATSAAITAARVAASLPASLPSSVRKATLEAAATAAVEASLEGPQAMQGSDATTAHTLEVPMPVQMLNQQTQDPGDSSEVAQIIQDKQQDKQPQQPPPAAKLDHVVDQKSAQIPDRPQDDSSMPKKTSDHADDLHKADVAEDLHKADKADVAHTMALQSKGVAKDDQARTPKEERLLYVGVFSKPVDFDKRVAMRSAWLSELRHLYADPAKILVEFVIGRKPLKAASLPVQTLAETGVATIDSKEARLDASLSEEFQLNRDLFHVPYEELPVKVLMFFAHAVEMRYRFVMKIDIDQELLFRPLIPVLRSENLDALVYAGQHLKDVSLLQAKKNKAQQIKQEKYFSGPCYLSSFSLAQRISKTHLDHSIMLWSYNTVGSDVDDMDMGQWVAYEDKLLLQLEREKQKHVEEDATDMKRVDYRLMDLCAPLLPKAFHSNQTQVVNQ